MSSTATAVKVSLFSRLHGWFDRLPAGVQVALFTAASMIATGVLEWVRQNYTHWTTLPTIVLAGIGILVPILIGAVTTWTEKFGRKSPAAKARVEAAAAALNVPGLVVNVHTPTTDPATIAAAVKSAITQKGPNTL